MPYFASYLEDVLSSTTAPLNPVKDQLWWKLPDNTIYIWNGVSWVLSRSIAADDPTKAPIDSPHFTGQPTTPTPEPGTNNDQVASTHFVMTALENDPVDWLQVTGKPATFPPTLPIAQTGVTNLVNDLNLKAPINNPIFTGNPKSVTPPLGDISVSIATTAFVKAAIDNSGTSGTIEQYWRGDKSWQILDKVAVGLPNVDNTADINKPVSTDQAAADALRVLKAGDTMTGPLVIAPVGVAALLSLLSGAGQDAGTILSKGSPGATVYIESRMGANPRWKLLLGDTAPETGSTISGDGSDFILKRYRNDGVFLGDSIKILRADGVVSMPSGAMTLTRTPGDDSEHVATTAFVRAAAGNKENTITPGTVLDYWRGDKSWHPLNKAAVGLGAVDNTSDSDKPISTATQTALDLKAPINSPIFTGKVTLPQSSASGSGIVVPHGVAPTTPINGDFWSTSLGFYGRVNGVTVGPFGISGTGPAGPPGAPGAAGPAGPSGTQIMFIGDGPPASPIHGQTWWETDTGNMYVYYNDGTSAQWVSAHVGVLPDGSDGSGSGPVDWADITGKPATFPPTVPIAWTDISGKPVTFPPSAHVHPQSDITNLTTDLAARVLKTGDTMTGNLTLSLASPNLLLNKSASGQQPSIFGQKGGLNRWQLILGDSVAESTANAGSNFDIYRYGDDGIAIDIPFAINRATGIVNAPRLTTLTQGVGTNSTEAATTAFVTRADTTLPVVPSGAFVLTGGWDTILTPGWTSLINTGQANAPTPTGYYHCLVMNYGGNVTQMAVPYSQAADIANGISYRGRFGAAWTPWVSIAPTPAGSVAFFAMLAAPVGWLKANGAAISRTAYAALYAAIGTFYGAGDGSTTFNLPDLRGEFLRGLDESRGIDVGRVLGSVQLGAFETHTHTFTGSALAAHNHTASSGTESADHTHTFSDTSSSTSAISAGTPSLNNASGIFGAFISGSAFNVTTTAGSNHGTRVMSADLLPTHAHTVAVSGTTSGRGVATHTHVITNVAITAGTPAGTIGSNGGAETRPRNVALVACIKY